MIKEFYKKSRGSNDRWTIPNSQSLITQITLKSKYKYREYTRDTK